MKRLRTSIAVSLLTLSITQLQAQDFVFKVLANNGNNQIRVKGSENTWQPLKTGERLNKTDELMISDKGYLGMVHHTGRTLEIRRGGQYLVAELANKIKNGENTVMGKYAKFLLDKMSEDEKDVVKDYRKYQNATGAVKRALSTATALKVLMPKTTIVLGPDLTIRWTEADLPKPPVYRITLKDKYSETLKTLESEEPFITLDLGESNLSKQELIIFDVQVVGKKRYRSEEYGIKKIATKSYDEIKEEMAFIKQENNSENAMSYLLLATFFQEKELMLDAVTAYEKAIELEPEVAEFKLLYSRFISEQKF